jgi:hypothetical protein
MDSFLVMIEYINDPTIIVDDNKNKTKFCYSCNQNNCSFFRKKDCNHNFCEDCSPSYLINSICIICKKDKILSKMINNNNITEEKGSIDNCPICLEKINDIYIKLSKCKHTLCVSCAKIFLSTSTQCMICRTVII